MGDNLNIGIEESPTLETVTFYTSSEENNINVNNDDDDNPITSPFLSSSYTMDESSQNNDEHQTSGQRTRNPYSKINSFIENIANIYSDQSGSCESLTKGLSLAALAGAFLGIIMPQNQDLPSPLYRYISSMIGYMYFVAWSVSFYPQIITNYRNKSTEGLSTDASILAVLNYSCYSIYNVFFFWDKTIRQEYKDRHGADSDITVMSNDVAFAINALVLTIFILGQIVCYGGMKIQPVSKTCTVIVASTLSISLIQVVCILMKVPGFLWIDFLYFMATVKLILTIMTYIPQISLNFQRKSTQG